VQSQVARPKVVTPPHKVIAKVVSKPKPPLVTPTDMVEWTKVAQCETGQNWRMRGWIRSGGLGINNSNWVEYGGTRFSPNASEATPAEQVWVAKRIQAGGGVAGFVPDQWGCAGNW
jgi:hypothetical protein